MPNFADNIVSCTCFTGPMKIVEREDQTGVHVWVTDLSLAGVPMDNITAARFLVSNSLYAEYRRR